MLIYPIDKKSITFLSRKSVHETTPRNYEQFMAVEIPLYLADLFEWLEQTSNYKNLQQKVVGF